MKKHTKKWELTMTKDGQEGNPYLTWLFDTNEEAWATCDRLNAESFRLGCNETYDVKMIIR